MQTPAPTITEQELRRAANRYLDRYAPTIGQFRRVMMRRVRKAGGGEAGGALLEAEVQRRIRNGELDDRRYAVSWVEHLHRRGLSAAAIRNKLAGKGVGREDIAAAFEEVLSGQEEPEMEAAVSYARRRRLGVFRTSGQTDERWRKDLAAMVRAGHGYGVSQRALRGDTGQEDDG